MRDPASDRQRYLDAARKIIDQRDPSTDRDEILVTLEGAVAAVLVFVMGGDHRAAAGMLTEGLLPGVEGRIALGASRANKRKAEG